MRLAQFSHFFEDHLGGIELVADRLAREWSALGADVTWLATRSSMVRALSPGPVRKLELPAWHGVERHAGLPYPVPGLAALSEIWRTIRSSDVVVLHDSIYATNVAASIAARAQGKPVLLIQHIGAVPYAKKSLRLLMRLANLCLAEPVMRNASRVVFISELPRRHFAHVRTRRPPCVLFNGVDTSVFNPDSGTATRSEFTGASSFTRERPVALFVGRFVEKKGMNVLARLAAMMPEVEWVFAGHGPLDPRQLGLTNVQVYEGLRGTSLAELYRQSDLLVLPSVGEGLPLVVQEAMACGLPVVCGSDTAVADPDMRHLVTGIDVDARDVEATTKRFAAVIPQLLRESGDQRARTERSRFASEHYNWTKTAKRYLNILAEATAETSARSDVVRQLSGSERRT